MTKLSRWDHAALALWLVALDPRGLGGIALRARSGPVRDRYVEALRHLPAPLHKIHPAISPDAILGGLDLAQTLQQGRPVRTAGLRATSGSFVLTMAERCPPSLAALLAQQLDQGRLSPLIVLDEGASTEERAPQSLLDRVAFGLDLDDLPLTMAPMMTPPDLLAAQARLATIRPTADQIATLTALAARFGIHSLRAPLFALRAAAGLAALHGLDTISDDDIETAAMLVYPSRATQVPQEPDTPDDAPDPPAPDPDGDTPDTDQDRDDALDHLPDEMLVEAVRALVPPDLLAGLSPSGTVRSAAGSGAGQKRKGNRRGRPLPSRPGRLNGEARVDLVATLRQAAPWQKIRAQMAPNKGGICVLPSDIYVKRSEIRSDRLLVFAVDASGSAALARFAEAKGAIELLLGQAYAQRDHVALVAFRGGGAELLLPPTRSLVQAKRRLAALPGGGATPLASGLRISGEVALQATRQGLSPSIAVLTDGRPNVALDGTQNRAQAQTDAEQIATWLGAMGLPGVVLDVGRRPHPGLRDLSQRMGARYLPLPRADAQALNRVLQDNLD